MSDAAERKRDPRLDVIRLTALFFVCATHFYLHSGYTELTMEGPRMFIMTAAKSFFLICVPMFITLTGYLMCEKKLTVRYFKGIIKVLCVYLFSSALYSVYSVVFLGKEFYPGEFVRTVLKYKGTPYGWYIEMYIGLFLLIPFINMALDKLNSKKRGLALLLVLFIVIGLPSLANVFSFESKEVFLRPRLASRYVQILPDWWEGFYPIFYYCLGWYLKKYPFRPKLGIHISLLALSVLADGGFNFYKSYGGPFVSAAWNWNSNPFMMVTTFLFFSLLLRIPVKPAGGKGAAFLKLLSDSVLGAYLVSVIFDERYYAILKDAVPAARDRMVYAPLPVLATFLSSMAVSILMTLIIRALSALFALIGKKIKRETSKKPAEAGEQNDSSH